MANALRRVIAGIHSASVLMIPQHPLSALFFFNDTATTEIYTLSLHDALPISRWTDNCSMRVLSPRMEPPNTVDEGDRKSTRLNSSHQIISYAVFCLKKKKRQ